jgi:hypothetical protein
MKKTLLTLILALSTTLIFAQRQNNWSVEEILEPTELRRSATNVTPVTFKIACKNNSTTDTIYATDTFCYYATTTVGSNGITNSPQANVILFSGVVGKNVNPGDTVHISRSFSYNINFNPDLTYNASFRISSFLFYRVSGSNRLALPTLTQNATNTKTKTGIVWYNSKNWGVNVNALTTENVSVYPNPTNDVLNIQLNAFNSELTGTVEIVDVTGKVILTETINNFAGNTQLNVSSLDKGLYIVRVSNGVSTLTSKVIVD